MQNTSSSWGGWLRANGFYLAFLVFLIAFPFILGALTESSPYGVARGDRMIMRGESVRWQAVLIEVYILAILAMSYNLLFGFTGVISFGHALFFGLSAYILGLVFLDHPDWDSTVGLIVGCVSAIGICGLLGLLMGLVTLRLRGVYFAIFTLAVAEMAFIFFGRWERTHAEDGFALDQLPLWIDPTQNRLTFYYIALALFVFTFMFIRRLMASPTGAVFEAIRENEDRAQAIGYDTLRYKLFSIAISAMLAGAAGLLHVMLNKKVGPELLSVVHTVDPLLMTLIGGAGTLLGPIIGAAGLHLLDVFLSDSHITIGSTVIDIANIWQLLLGMIFIAAVLVFPYGVIGTWRRWRNQSKQV
jgi:branched-chain amino acid transport system permease protein